MITEFPTASDVKESEPPYVGCYGGGIALAIVLLLGAIGSVGAASQPLGWNEADTANYRWLHKPVLESRVLDEMEETNRWSHRGFGTLTLTTERARGGTHSLRLVSPTKNEKPNAVNGRPSGEAAARRELAGEDWSGFNRISCWVYPHLPGFRVISLLIKLHNAGAVKVPDSYNREGLQYVLLKPDQWNQVVWEIPHLARDQVTGLEFIYRLQGNEPGATNRVCFDLDHLELQRVEADDFEGWTIAPGRLAYSQSGYRPRDPKMAVGNGLVATEFSVWRQGGDKAVLVNPIETRKTSLGEFQVLDFSRLRVPGLYQLKAGGLETRWFPVGEEVWRDSIRKTINFFNCERCGQAVPGIHDVCHADWQGFHNDRSLVINGGWHDAGDLSQGLVNTSEAAHAMLSLAAALRASDPELSRRLRDEARWGLEWMHKTRFGDGFRVTWATMDYWTDGVVGTPDDTRGEVRDSPFENFLAASTEALAARVLRADDPALAEKSLQLARADWQFALDKTPRMPSLELAGAAAMASLDLFQATQQPQYAQSAQQFADTILACQQREYLNTNVPLAGFFHTSPKRDRLLHYFHRGHEQAPIVALAGLCELFPGHTNWMRWYSAVVLHSEYLKRLSGFTAPYGMLPASIYRLDESNEPRFREQVLAGVKLDDHHYLRRFPVWFDFRGNCGTVLSQAKALSTAARLRGNRDLAALARRQLEWCVGFNPFAQSLMWGEGHDYAPQYTALSGDMAGSLPVGIQTRANHDLPYWPAANCYNYKEVWVHPSARWLAIMADLEPQPTVGQPVRREGITALKNSHAVTGAGEVALRLEVEGQGMHRFKWLTSNLTLEAPDQQLQLTSGQSQTRVWQARTVSPLEPWVAVMVVDDDPSQRLEHLGMP